MSSSFNLDKKLRRQRGPDHLESGQNISLIVMINIQPKCSKYLQCYLKIQVHHLTGAEPTSTAQFFSIFTVTFDAEDSLTDVRDLHRCLHRILPGPAPNFMAVMMIPIQHKSYEKFDLI